MRTIALPASKRIPSCEHHAPDTDHNRPSCISRSLRALALAIVVLSSFAVGSAQAPDSCLTPLPPDYVNPDSVKVDTCVGSADSGAWYARQWFYVFFLDYAIDLPSAPADSIVEVHWSVISPQYTEIRGRFKELESRFGTFVLRKESPDASGPDVPDARLYHLRFENYVNIADATEALFDIEGIVTTYENRTSVSDAPERDAISPSAISIAPNPSGDYALVVHHENSSAGTIRIVDLFGNVVATALASRDGTTRIVTRHLSSGRYFVLVGSHSIPLTIRR